MPKAVRRVILVLAVLVACFIAWQLVFNDGGILKTAYNSVATGVNNQYDKVAGNGATILPNWGANSNGKAFDINTQ